MEVVPYRHSGTAADQSLQQRFFQFCHITMHITSDPHASGASRAVPVHVLNDIGEMSEPLDAVTGVVRTDRSSSDLTGAQTSSATPANLDDVGKVVWQSGFVLAEFLLRLVPFGPEWRVLRAVDLGTGTGVVGIALALAGADVILTDLPHIVPLAASNVQANCDERWHRASVVPYCWGEEPGAWGDALPDLITGGDVIYQAEHFDALVKSICRLSAPHTITYLSYRHRNCGEAEFQKKAEAAGLAVEEVPGNMLHHEYQDGHYHVLRLCRLS